MQSRQYPEFVTITCLEWKPVLAEDRFKDIIIESLRFLTKENRVTIYAFVLMRNHFHMIWQMLNDHKREDVQRDFLKYTSQRILKLLHKEKHELLNMLLVNAKDRKYQVWERNSLGIPLWSHWVLHQKLRYIHYNPVKAGLCKYPDEYRYSSAGFYYKNERHWDFLVHIDG